MHRSELSSQTIDEIREMLIGVTIPDLERVADLAGCDVGDLEDRLVDHDINVERCEGCEYFHDCGDLTDGTCEECLANAS